MAVEGTFDQWRTTTGRHGVAPRRRGRLRCGATLVSNSSTTRAELTFAIAVGGEPADFRFSSLMRRGLPVPVCGRLAQPTTRPADQCSGVHLSDEAIDLVTQEVDFGARVRPVRAGEAVPAPVKLDRSGEPPASVERDSIRR